MMYFTPLGFWFSVVSAWLDAWHPRRRLQVTHRRNGVVYVKAVPHRCSA